MEVRKAMELRISSRAFSDRQVEGEKIARMLDSARWSPSFANKQPWRFVVVGKEDASRAGVESALMAGNDWAKRAPLLVVAGARKADDGVIESREYFLHDTGLAAMSLFLRAVDQGLLVHPMAGWFEAPLRSALSLPEDFTPIVVVAIGYKGDPSVLDDETRAKDEAPRERMPLGEIAFQGKWGVPFDAGDALAPAKKIFEAPIQKRFCDTDALGHVNNVATMAYLETGRVLFFKEVLGMDRVEDFQVILAEATCRYIRPIMLHDEVRVRMWVTDISRSSFRNRCEIFDPRDGRVFAEADTVGVTYDYSAGRPTPIPPKLVAALREYAGHLS